MILINHKLLSVLVILREFQTYKKHLVYIHIMDFFVHNPAIQQLLLIGSFFVDARAKFDQYLLK